jgi:C1A family cysteine protease
VPDWVQTGTGVASSAIRAQSQLPSKFDLRERGVVTPVKNQGSWGTCWTFDASATAEASILSSMGTTCE